MSLGTTLADIITRLRQGRFPNEQAMRNKPVLYQDKTAGSPGALL